jgi:prophage maintenance system killer protein
MRGKRERSSQRRTEEIAARRVPNLALLDAVGVPAAVERIVHSARFQIEASASQFGKIAASGVMNEGTIWFAGQAAENERAKRSIDLRGPPTSTTALIPARVFSTIAQGHPYFDGNKRTAFLACVGVGLLVGFDLRKVPYRQLEEDVLHLTARDASIEEIARWLLRNVLIIPGGEEE